MHDFLLIAAVYAFLFFVYYLMQRVFVLRVYKKDEDERGITLNV